MERWGQMNDGTCAGIADPAEGFAVSFRISGRLGWTHPDMARFLAGRVLELPDAPAGLLRARCATSKRLRLSAASPSRMPGSRSARSPAGC